MPAFKDTSGQRFGKLIAIKRVENIGRESAMECRCDCGNMVVVRTYCLRNGHTKSCGCINSDILRKRNTSHGLAHAPEQIVWQHMKGRCHNPRNKSFADYGGRGITVCKRWRNSFRAFYEDMGQRPSPDHQIDRIDNDGPYSPNNCRWANRREQANNKRNNLRLTHQGKTKTLAQWARLTGIKSRVIHDRVVKLGWSIDRALTEPVNHHAARATVAASE